MKNLILISLFLITFTHSVSANQLVCQFNEIKISGSYVNPYKRSNGTPVDGYYKKEYCRKSNFKAKAISFEDTIPGLLKLNEKFKPWTDGEITIVTNTLDRLPPFFQDKLIKSFHRGTRSSFENNPASTIPLTNQIVLYDQFFKSKNKERILVHEISHIVYKDLTSEEKIKFATILGWKLSPLTPPVKVIYADSKDSPAEDISNNLEAFFYDSERQSNFNHNITNFIKTMIGNLK